MTRLLRALASSLLLVGTFGRFILFVGWFAESINSIVLLAIGASCALLSIAFDLARIAERKP